MPLLLAFGAASLLLGGGIFAAGEGVESTGNGAIKIAAATAILFVAYKQVKK